MTAAIQWLNQHVWDIHNLTHFDMPYPLDSLWNVVLLAAIVFAGMAALDTLAGAFRSGSRYDGRLWWH
jgi:hypothetical protein